MRRTYWNYAAWLAAVLLAVMCGPVLLIFSMYEVVTVAGPLLRNAAGTIVGLFVSIALVSVFTLELQD